MQMGIQCYILIDKLGSENADPPNRNWSFKSQEPDFLVAAFGYLPSSRLQNRARGSCKRWLLTLTKVQFQIPLRELGTWIGGVKT
jgi:hypothetical protein